MGAYGMPDNFDDWATRGPKKRDGWWCADCERRIGEKEKMYRKDGEDYCEECAEKRGITHEVE